jgi:hypothetical protein
MKKNNKIKIKFIKGKRYKNIVTKEILWYEGKIKQDDGSYTYMFLDTCNERKYYDNENNILNKEIRPATNKDKTDYEIKYNEFWKKIVEKKGKMDQDAVKRELSDYSKVIDNCSCIYDIVTNGRISKPLTDWKVVESEYTDILSEEYLDKEGTTEDIKNMINENKTLDDIKKELIDYFEIDMEEDKEDQE